MIKKVIKMKKYIVITYKGETLYDYCKRNNCTDVLDRWDYDLNRISPKDVVNLNNEKYWFKCENHIHKSELRDIGNIIKTKKVPPCTTCNSFGMYCIKNGRQDLLKRWDYDLNTIDPFKLAHSSTKKQYFKCPKGIHPSELKDVNNLLKESGTGKCTACWSIGQWGIDNISKDFLTEYWSDKNTIDPFSVSSHSGKKIWIKCQNKDYHEDYEISCVNFVKGKRCPYCAGCKVNIRDSVGYKYPKIFDCWVEKKMTPYDYTCGSSGKKHFFYCKKHDHYYKRTIADQIGANFECPLCSKERTESRLQEKVRKYLESLGYNVLHEWDCTLNPINPKSNYTLRFDNEIPVLHLVVEVNGQQHYKSSSIYYGYRIGQKDREEAFKDLQWRDQYKKQYAIDHGYTYCAIPYWEDNKDEDWKKHLDKVVSRCKKYQCKN